MTDEQWTILFLDRQGEREAVDARHPDEPDPDADDWVERTLALLKREGLVPQEATLG